MTNKNKDTASESEIVRGVGLDIGTMNLVSARRTDQGVETRRMRDVFLDLPPSAKRMLKLSNVNFIERDDELLILGDAALETANVFNKDARRPLSVGIISASEIDSLEVLGFMVKNVLGEPEAEDEVCCFSIPAVPIDEPGRDTIYHQGVFERIIRQCGYEPIPTNEAMAIIYAETAKDGFSGLAFSFGSGMTNVALAIKTIEGMSFSVGRGGDWIDDGVSRSVGLTASRACALKEQGVDLKNPKGREQEAVAFYYRALIEYALDQVVTQFRSASQMMLQDPIPMIVSGGTSLAPSFIEFFIEVFDAKKKKFPIEISEIRHAKEPLNAVAHGALIQAMQEED